MYKTLEVKGLNTIILADSAGIYEDKKFTLMNQPACRLYYWCNCCGEISLPGSSLVVGDPATLPSPVRELYDSYQEETSPFHTYTVTLNAQNGMMTTLLVDSNWVAEDVFASGKDEASDKEMDVMYEALVRTAISLRDEEVLPTGCVILALKDTDPDGHELGIFFPAGICKSAFPEFKAAENMKRVASNLYDNKLLPIAEDVFDQVETQTKIHRCPKCGGLTFRASAHVVQEWVVDENGNYMECSEECSEVVHVPTGDNLWSCHACGHTAPGDEFLSAPTILDSMGLREKVPTGYKRVRIAISGYAVVPGNTDEEVKKNVMNLSKDDFDWENVDSNVLDDVEIVENCGPCGETV